MATVNRSAPVKEVYAYDRHLFLFYKNPDSWPRCFETSNDDPLPKLFISTWKARKNDMNLKTAISICEAREDIGYYDGDIVIFPHLILYKDLNVSNIERFFEDVLVNGNSSLGIRGFLYQSNIFVCVHGGHYGSHCDVEGGPALLINSFNNQLPPYLDKRDRVLVIACSHVGWENCPGNVLIYSPGPDIHIMGHWYNILYPYHVSLMVNQYIGNLGDVSIMVNQHIGKGELIQELWWGRVKMERPDAQKVAKGKVTFKDKTSTDEYIMQRNHVDDVRQYEQKSDWKKRGRGYDQKLSYRKDTYKGKILLTAVIVLGGVVAAVAVTYQSYSLRWW